MRRPTCAALHAPPYMRRPTCAALHAPPYMRRPTCAALHAPPYMRRPTCTALHAHAPYMHIAHTRTAQPALPNLHRPRCVAHQHAALHAPPYTYAYSYI